MFFLKVGGNPIAYFEKKDDAKDYARYRYGKQKSLAVVIQKVKNKPYFEEVKMKQNASTLINIIEKNNEMSVMLKEFSINI